MKAVKFLLELEALCEQKGYRIRKEKGAFAGNHCLVEGEKLILLNSRLPVESQVGTLARVLKELDLEDIYIKPAVRRELTDLWKRSGHPDPSELDLFL